MVCFHCGLLHHADARYFLRDGGGVVIGHTADKIQNFHICQIQAVALGNRVVFQQAQRQFVLLFAVARDNQRVRGGHQQIQHRRDAGKRRQFHFHAVAENALAGEYFGVLQSLVHGSGALFNQVFALKVAVKQSGVVGDKCLRDAINRSTNGDAAHHGGAFARAGGVLGGFGGNERGEDIGDFLMVQQI